MQYSAIKKPRFKTLKKIFFLYYRYSITDFFSAYSSLKKFKSSKWRNIKNLSFFIRSKYVKFNKLKYYTHKRAKKRNRLPYISQNRSFLLYTFRVGKYKKKLYRSMLNYFFNLKIFGLKNKSDFKKTFKPLIKKTKGYKTHFFKTLILNQDNKINLFLFRHYFTSSLEQSRLFLQKKNYILIDNKFGIKGSVFKNKKIKKGSLFILKKLKNYHQSTLLKDFFFFKKKKLNLNLRSTILKSNLLNKIK